MDLGLLAAGRNALRLCLFFMTLAGCEVAGAAFFQALGKAVPALLLSLSRQVPVLIPLIILMPRFYGLDGVWLSFPVADLITFIITMVFVLLELKNVPLGPGQG